MAKKETVTALIVQTDVPDAMELLKNELKNLKTIVETPYKTTSNLEIFGDIKKETNIENLIKAASYVMGKEDAYIRAAAVLNLQEFPSFNISGGNSEQWVQDIKLRIQIIQIDERRKELENLLKDAEEFVTKEHKYQIFLKKMEKVVNK